jgi:hypothetical protein
MIHELILMEEQGLAKNKHEVCEGKGAWAGGFYLQKGRKRNS